MKLSSLIIFSAFMISGCVWPGIDNRKQGPFDNRTIPAPAPSVRLSSPPSAPDAVSVSPGNNSGTATITWLPVTWGRPVTYFVGWGLQPTNYPNIANTAQTSYQVRGLKYNTLYYFNVKTVDSFGLQSDWGKWWHYAPPKPNGPKPSPVP